MQEGQSKSDSVIRAQRTVGLRGALLVGFICVLISVLLTAGGLAGAYLIGRNTTDANIDSSRQMIVQEGEVIADVAQKASPSVVSIVTEQQSTVQSLFYGNQTRKSQAAGTGVIIDASGYILTNKHVVPEGITNLGIVTYDGTEYQNVKVVGRDPLNDLAIIKVAEPKDFVPAKLGNSDSVRVGHKVIAIGNALGQFQNTVTSGIISGIGRPIEASSEEGALTEQLTNLFQTDAAINSGNSGGPLINYNGEVIGINTAVAADAQNVGFAIPINETKGIIASVQETGKVSRPFLGVRFIMLNKSIADELQISVNEGAYIDTEQGSVVAGSPAEKAGIRPKDVIKKVNDTAVTERVPLTSAISRYKVGDTVSLIIVRDGREQKVSATLAEAPTN